MLYYISFNPEYLWQPTSLSFYEQLLYRELNQFTMINNMK